MGKFIISLAGVIQTIAALLLLAQMLSGMMGQICCQLKCN